MRASKTKLFNYSLPLVYVEQQQENYETACKSCECTIQNQGLPIDNNNHNSILSMVLRNTTTTIAYPGHIPHCANRYNSVLHYYFLLSVTYSVSRIKPVFSSRIASQVYLIEFDEEDKTIHQTEFQIKRVILF